MQIKEEKSNTQMKLIFHTIQIIVENMKKNNNKEAREVTRTIQPTTAIIQITIIVNKQLIKGKQCVNKPRNILTTDIQGWSNNILTIL